MKRYCILDIDNGSEFLCSVYCTNDPEEFKWPGFMLELSSGESICKKEYNLNYFKMLIYVRYTTAVLYYRTY